MQIEGQFESENSRLKGNIAFKKDDKNKEVRFVQSELNATQHQEALDVSFAEAMNDLLKAQEADSEQPTAWTPHETSITNLNQWKNMLNNYKIALTKLATQPTARKIETQALSHALTDSLECNHVDADVTLAHMQSTRYKHGRAKLHSQIERTRAPTSDCQCARAIL